MKFLKVFGPGLVRDDHHGKEGKSDREDQAIEKNYQCGFSKVEVWGTRFRIHLSKRFCSAHGEDRMSQGDEDAITVISGRKITAV